MRWLVTTMHIELEPLTRREAVTWSKAMARCDDELLPVRPLAPQFTEPLVASWLAGGREDVASASVDVEDGAVDECCFVAGEIDGGSCDVCRGTRLARRRGAHRSRACGGDIAGVVEHHSWREGIHSDALRAELG